MSGTKVKDLMVPVQDLDTVQKSDFLEDIIDIFLREEGHRERLVLAVEEGETIIGILSVGDILRTLKRLTRTYGQHEIFESTSLAQYGTNNLIRNTEKDLKVGFSLKVKEIMKVNRQKINLEDTGLAALDLLLENNLRVLPVYDKGEEEIVGIIREFDLLECIVDLWKRGR